MADSHEAHEIPRAVPEHVLHEAHAELDLHFRTVADGNAAALLPTMLQGIEAPVDIQGYIFLVGIDAENAAFLVKLVEFKHIVGMGHHVLLPYFPARIASSLAALAATSSRIFSR